MSERMESSLTVGQYHSPLPTHVQHWIDSQPKEGDMTHPSDWTQQLRDIADMLGLLGPAERAEVADMERLMRLPVAESCGNCFFSRQYNVVRQVAGEWAGVVSTECHLRPPLVREEDKHTYWPEVKATDWCGEYKARP